MVSGAPGKKKNPNPIGALASVIRQRWVVSKRMSATPEEEPEEEPQIQPQMPVTEVVLSQPEEATIDANIFTPKELILNRRQDR